MNTVRRYAKGIITAAGSAATLAVALGWTHERWVALIVAALTTAGVVRVPNKAA